MLLTNQRTHFCVSIQRRTNLNGFALFNHGLEELRVNSPLHQNPTTRRTYLALIHKDTEQRPINRWTEIRIGEKDARRFPSQLQDDLLDGVDRRPEDRLP